MEVANKVLCSGLWATGITMQTVKQKLIFTHPGTDLTGTLSGDKSKALSGQMATGSTRIECWKWNNLNCLTPSKIYMTKNQSALLVK